MGDTVFPNPTNRPGLRLYYYSGKSGFTTPVWTVNLVPYSTINMGAESPIKTWLITAGLPYDSDLQSDSNQDGVNLLMAYALNLDPSKNLTGSLPKPVLGANQLGISYYSGAPGISYTVVTSTDLIHWTSSGVSVSPPDVNLVRTATVPVGSGARFMRLMVEN